MMFFSYYYVLLITQANRLKPGFLNGDIRRLRNWIWRFLKQQNFSMLDFTHQAQDISIYEQKKTEEFVDNVIEIEQTYQVL
jgi:hypothetical protein